jgi:hypothetical protein
MPKPRCLEDHEFLALLDGGKATKGVQGHLDGCPACMERLERLRAEVQSLRRNSTDANAPDSWHK